MNKELEKKTQNLYQQKQFRKIVDLYSNNTQEFEKNLFLLESVCLSYFNLNKFQKSEDFSKKILSIKPKHLGAHHILARIYLNKNLDLSIDYYKKLLQFSKNNVQYASEYLQILLKLENYEKAINILQDLIIDYPKDINLKIQLAKISIESGEYDKAEVMIKYILKNHNATIKEHAVLNLLATVYHNKGDYDLAKSFYSKSIKLEPNDIEHFINFAILEQENGNFEQAKFLLERANKINESSEAYRLLSINKKFETENDNIFESMLSYGTSESFKNLDNNNKASLYFSIGKAYEDLNKFNLSADYYLKANTLKRQTFTNYDFHSVEKEFEVNKLVFDKTFFDNFSNTNLLGREFIFIIGMPRSGTTLLEQILSSHNKVHGAGELNYLSHAISNTIQLNDLANIQEKLKKIKKEEIDNIGKNYCFLIESKIKVSNNSKYVIDKNPLNFKNLPFIFSSLPKSKVIHIKRNQNDNCFSIFKNFFSQNVMPWSYSQNELKSYYTLYQNFMNEMIKLTDNFVYETTYEKLISNLEVETRKILDFLELDWDLNCLDFHKNKRSVKTASVSQVREKIYLTSKGKWENYKTFFKDLFV